MDSKKVMELLTSFNLEGRIDPQDREGSILNLLNVEYGKYMNRKDKDRDEEMEELFDEAIQYQKNVVAKQESSVIILQKQTPPPKNAPTTRYENEISILKDKSNGKNQNTATSNTSQLNSVEALWFVSKNHNAQIDTEFEEIKKHLAVGETDTAKKKLDSILDKEPNNAGAYLAMYMAKAKIKTLDAFFQKQNLSFDVDNDLKRVMQYVTPEQKNFATKETQERFKERTYAKAMSMKPVMRTSAECKTAAELFESIGDFKDARKLASECRTKEKELLKKETDAQSRLQAMQTEKDEKEEINSIHTKLFSGATFSETKLNEYIKRLNELTGKYNDYNAKVKEALDKANKELANQKKQATAAKLATVSKKTDGIAYAIILIVMLYFAMSFRFTFLHMKGVVEDRRFSFISEETYENLEQVIDTVDTFFSFGAVPMWDNYGYENKNLFVENSFANYILLFQEVEQISFYNTKSINIYTLQNIIPRVSYSSTTSKNLEVSKACGEFELRDTSEVESVLLKNLVNGKIHMVCCDNLKTIEIQKSSQDISISTVDCPSLETVILPPETRKITIDKADVQIVCENTELEIIYEN